MNIPAATVELVKRFEGFRPRAYLCPAGKLTVGWGTTRGVTPGMRVSSESAEWLLYRDLNDVACRLRPLVDVELTENQWAALLCFVYNVGVGAFETSTLRERINARDFAAVPAELTRWNKATVKGVKTVLPGLVKRRPAEAELWSTR